MSGVVTLTSPTVPIADVSRPQRPRLRVKGVLGGLILAVDGAVAVALLYAVAVLEPTGRRIDNRMMRAVMSRADWMTRSEVRMVLEIAAPAAMIAVAALVLRTWWHGQRGRAVAVAVIVLGSQLITQALKAFLPGGYDDGNSLPSGHVTVAVTTTLALVLLIPRLTTLILALGIPAVALTAVATMLVGWHRPSDVVAAVAVVVGVAGLTQAGAALSSGRRRPRSG